MSQPCFATPRLRLRPRRLADTEACLAMDREPGVTRFVDGPWKDPAGHRAFIEARTLGPWPPGLGYWSVLDAAAGGFLGWVLLIPEDGEGPEIEIGWRLRPAAWGRGIATEAAAPVLRHGFVALGLPRIVAGIHAENAASLRVAAKLGLRPRGTAGHEVRCALDRREFLAFQERPDGPPH
ncbi:GNAT family N-acetyltransferase [Crenalkalicoccus roseus]|uniref:GNAT family N-acetyltransferase n=1 Tax=Crenalkalicoccus roseus TaxID=1485588 RepID=UPI001080F484|nr:GNAT family N-acetyltransferase [Crenalkalicoccus roseus]